MTITSIPWKPVSTCYLFTFNCVLGLISSLFADRYEDAFGACRIVQGVAGMIVYTLSENLCMMLKIVIIMTSCIVGVVMYIVMEMMRKMCPHKK